MRIGDLVACVDASPCRTYPYPGAPFGVELNSYWRVEDVWEDDGDGEIVIALSGIENEGVEGDVDWEGYEAARFRKVNPAEPEFISLIRGLGVDKGVREDA